MPSDKAEWPYLVGPSLLVPIVLSIADPSLGGHRVIALGALAGLVLAGLAAAARLRRGPRRRGTAAAPAVDPTTGFYTRSRLRLLLPAELAAAEAAHQPLTLVCVRLDHFRDLHDFSGEQGCEAVVQTVARRLKRTLGPDDLAFRLTPDTLAFTLRDRDARATRTWAQAAGHEVAGRLIDRHRQTLSFGCASYPPSARSPRAARRGPDPARHSGGRSDRTRDRPLRRRDARRAAGRRRAVAAPPGAGRTGPAKDLRHRDRPPRL